jgi:hypothetical protein
MTIFILLMAVRLNFAQFPGMDDWNRQTEMPRLLDSLTFQQNFYDRQNNIAALIEDESKKSLWLGIKSANLSGNFHHPFASEEKNNLDFAVRTIYPLSERDIFKGTFTYQRDADKNVLWIHQSRKIGENPFLLGDSSSGDFDLSGLAWSAEWAHRFSQQLSAGLGFHYNVDQRLKQVFPKPLNKHRDILINTGLQLSTSGWKLGLQYMFISQQEKVEITKYSLEQNLTPVILKFRYSDLPVILRGKTSEERKVEDETNLLGIQISHSGKHIYILGSFQYANGYSETTDGGSRGKAEGSYDKELYYARIQTGYINKKIRIFLNYHWHFRDLNAYHPDFGFTVIRYPVYVNKISTGLRYSLSNAFNLYGEFEYENRFEQKRDLMANNYWTIESDSYGLILGMTTYWSNTWETNLWTGYQHFDYPHKERSVNGYTEFYRYLFEQPYQFFSGKENNINGGIKLIFHYFPVLDLELFASYGLQNGSIGEGYEINKNWIAALTTKLYIF